MCGTRGGLEVERTFGARKVGCGVGWLGEKSSKSFAKRDWNVEPNSATTTAKKTSPHRDTVKGHNRARPRVSEREGERLNQAGQGEGEKQSA